MNTTRANGENPTLKRALNRVLWDDPRKMAPVDGVMKPGAPTETAINRHLSFAADQQNDSDSRDRSVVVPPSSDPNMPIINTPFPPRSGPYIDQNGNIVLEGKNPRTGFPISPSKGPY